MIKMNTLKKNFEFKNVLAKGKFYNGKYIEIIILKNNKASNFVGIAVQKKVGKAIKRNRIKRLIRENYRLMECDIKKGYDIVILWKKNVFIEFANFNNIKEDMTKLFERANLNK